MHKLDIAQHSTLQPEASLEYLIGESAKLVAHDTAKDIDLLGRALTELKDRAGHPDQELVGQNAVHDSHGLFDQAADLLSGAAADTGIHYDALAHEPAIAATPDWSAAGSVMEFMMEYEKLMNKEAQDDHKTLQAEQTAELGFKDGQIDHEITKIGEMQQEAAQRNDAAMDSANKETWIGVASGSMHIGENNTSSIQAELAQTDLAIKDVLKEISDQQQKENDIKDGVEAHKDDTSTAAQNLDHAVSSYNQVLSAAGSAVGDQNPSEPTTQSQGSHDESSSHPHFELPAMMTDTSHHWPL